MKWFPEPSEPSCSRQRAASARRVEPGRRRRGLQRLDASRGRRREALVHAARRQRDRPLDRLAAASPATLAAAHLLRRPLRADGDHAAADVHADGGRDDRAQRRDDGADRRALAQVGVGHEGQVRVDERHGRGGDCLGPGVLLEDRCPADQPRAEVLACHEAGAWHGVRCAVAVIPGTRTTLTCHDPPVTDTAVLPRTSRAWSDGPPLASWSRRVVAALLDDAILGGATWVLLGSGVVAPSLTPDAVLGTSERDGLVHSPVAWLASALLVGILVAMLALQGWTGATPGKRVAGVAIVRASDGLPVGSARLGAAGRRAPARRDLPHRVPAAPVERPQADVRRLDRRHAGRPDTRASGAPVVRAVPARAVGARSTVVSVAAVGLCVLGVGVLVRRRVRGRLRVRDRRCRARPARTSVTASAYADVAARPDVRRPAAVGDRVSTERRRTAT